MTFLESQDKQRQARDRAAVIRSAGARLFTMASERAPVSYSLPDGRAVLVPYDVCRMAGTIDFQLASGRIVLAVISPGQR